MRKTNGRMARADLGSIKGSTVRKLGAQRTRKANESLNTEPRLSDKGKRES